MSIPGSQRYVVPPPLPPPTIIDGFDQGIDLGWRLQNTESSKKFRLAPIKAGSSLLSGHSRSSQLHKEEDEDMHMDLDDTYPKPLSMAHQSSLSLQHNSNRKIGTPERDYRNDERFDSERPLARQLRSLSNQAYDPYDQQLLNKIGKPRSPPRYRQSHISGHDSFGSGLSHRSQPTSQARPVLDSSIPSGLSTRALPSPNSATLSPRHSWRDTVPYSPFDRPSHILPSPTRQEDKIDTRTRSERGSYDSITFTDMDSINEDAESVTSHGITERPQSLTQHGNKRRAMSPLKTSGFIPSISKHDSKGPHANIATPQPQSAGSLVSSASSSMTFPSYAPSTILSHTSSRTSNSPASYEKRQVDSPSMPAPPRPETKAKPVEIASKPTRIGAYFICACCPKKPKRFDNEQQLRLHENEKQFTCAFCSNRFKNKNEAERHQNSLHVRNQSWSCSAIATYQAAFYPCSTQRLTYDTSPTQPNISTINNINESSHTNDTDLCGFCGLEFSNPPDWEDRAEHLINGHKFGECNTSKKFFRADHFRQHLKHSHGGKSGRWTNILEGYCQRDEEENTA